MERGTALLLLSIHGPHRGHGVTTRRTKILPCAVTSRTPEGRATIRANAVAVNKERSGSGVVIGFVGDFTLGSSQGPARPLVPIVRIRVTQLGVTTSRAKSLPAAGGSRVYETEPAALLSFGSLPATGVQSTRFGEVCTTNWVP